VPTTRAVTAVAFLVLSLALAPVAAEGQRAVTFGGAVGYLSAGGGDPAWDGAHGPAASIALGLRLGGRTAITLEGGFQRSPTTRDVFECGPGQCTEPQRIDAERRRTGITVDLLFRLHSPAGRVRPYGVIGLGHATARPREHHVRTRPDGTIISDDRFGSDTQAGGVVLGGGIEIGNPAAGVAFTAGVRGRAAVSGYDGGPTGVGMLSITAGVVLR
jgi:hypothetical protein